MWNQDHAKHYYNDVELMAQRWQPQETYAPSFEVQTPEHVATQLPEQPNPSAASDFEMALLQTILMHQQRSQPQQQVQEQQQQLLQQQQLQQLQQVPLPQLQQLQQLMLLQQQMQPAQLFLEAAMGPGGHQNLASNQVFDPEAHQIPERHGAEEADLERCYSAAVSAFLNQEDEDEDHDNDGDAGTNAEGQTETNYKEPVSFMQEGERKSRKTRNGGRRLHCSFHLSEAYLHYKVVPAIIGKGGENTRAIFDTTGAKVRVRGRGSGHQETGTNAEAPTGPMVTVSTTSETSFNDAVRQTCRLLLSVQDKMVHLYPGIKDELGDLCQYASMHDGRNFRLTENGMVDVEEAQNQDLVALKLSLRGRGRSKWRGV